MIALVVNTDNRLTAVLDELERELPGKVYRRIAREIVPPAERLLDRLLIFEPGPPRYPIAWASERQRRAFFATNGFGRGIPTRRTGFILHSWEIMIHQHGGELVIVAINSAPYAEFVYGPRQQPFHAGRWPVADDVVIDAAIELEADLEAMWGDVVESYIA